MNIQLHRSYLGYLIIGLLLFVEVSTSSFDPNVTIQSCSEGSVVIRLEDAAEGGLIYIQRRSSLCKRTTSDNVKNYTFDFTQCDLKYESKFRVIVQEHPHYQTGTDKVIPVMCIIDTADIAVTGVIFPEETSEVAIQKTIKPIVTMKLLTSSDDVSDGPVTLDDEVTLTLTLDEPYLEDFDIKASDCMASMLTLIKDECSEDQDLFPNFDHMSRGDLEATFRAFRPTNLTDSPDVDMTFTCTVVVCKGDCQKSLCGEIVGWGRRKRDADEEVERITVGATLRVISPGAASKEKQAHTICADRSVASLLLCVVGVSLLLSWMVTACVARKLRRLRDSTTCTPTEGRRLSMAKAVGRRLSTMLNFPVGYDLKKDKVMDLLPEEQPTPPIKRRESVTVSTHSNDVDTNNAYVNTESDDDYATYNTENIDEVTRISVTADDLAELLSEICNDLVRGKGSKNDGSIRLEDINLKCRGLALKFVRRLKHEPHSPNIASPSRTLQHAYKAGHSIEDKQTMADCKCVSNITANLHKTSTTITKVGLVSDDIRDNKDNIDWHNGDPKRLSNSITDPENEYDLTDVNVTETANSVSEPVYDVIDDVTSDDVFVLNGKRVIEFPRMARKASEASYDC